MAHSHDHTGSDKSITFGLVLNGGFTVLEFIFGFITGSLALIADATHNLTDTVTLAVSFVANKVSRRKANDRKTFGYGRVTILAALINSLLMLGVSAFIVSEAIERLQNPHPIEGGIVAIVAFVGILINGSIAFMLAKHRSDLNMRSAYIDMLFDALSSVGAMVSGLIIMATGIAGIDTIVGLLIAGLLAYNAVKILIEAIQILLESTPKDVDINAITESITAVKKVKQADDMHIWAIRSGYNALSCHIIIDERELKNSRAVVEAVKQMLRDKYDIEHATIEVELEANARHSSHEKH